jgi:hypothetical protein
VKQHRGLAIHHILILIKYWQAKNAPKFTERRLASFEDWSAKVGGVLMTAGVEGFLDTHAPIILDAEKAAEDEFLIAAHKLHGINKAVSATDLFNWANNCEMGIIVGRTPEEKRSKFNEALRVLVGRTFQAGDDFFALHAQHGSGGSVEFDFQQVKTRK